MSINVVKKTVIVLLLMSVFILTALRCLEKTPSQWWYPFITDGLSDYYTAGPFGMTSNIREDNPVWKDIPEINKTISRMTYVMTRGKPDADIAWLYAEQEWPDQAALGQGLTPNKNESMLSRELTHRGLVYERISRENLLGASTIKNLLQVGEMRYKALMIDDLLTSSPELLEKVYFLAKQGVPVFWLGAMPKRAVGWKDHELRDRKVEMLISKLLPLISRMENVHTLVSLLNLKGIDSPLFLSGDSPQQKVLPGLRTQRRLSGNTRFVLLFNDDEKTLSVPLSSSLFNHPVYLLNPASGVTEVLNSNSKVFSIPAGRSRILQIGDVAPDWQQQQWQAPSIDYWPYVRWWWPGNKVNAEELVSELRSLYAAGFGGVEIQTLTIGMTKAYLQENSAEIYQVGTELWFANLRAVFEESEKLGMQVDLTMGSGWPTGGPFITDKPEQQLLMSSVDLESGVDKVLLPFAETPNYKTITNWIIHDTIGGFDNEVKLQAVTAARVGSNGQLEEFIDLSARVEGQYLHWKAPEGHWRIFVFYRNSTQHNVFASAFPGAELSKPNHRTLVIDHLDQAGAEEYLEKLGEPWLIGLSPYKPKAFFIDSFELIAELPWSVIFRQKFETQHGYDITPFLPLIFKRYGESKYFDMIVPPSFAFHAEGKMAERIREDYELTRAVLFREGYVLPIKHWTEKLGIELRLQAHGGYGDYLDTYQLADIPESEALFAGGSFDFLKLASSAGHIAGRNIISSESFIMLSRDFNRLQADDYYYLAGNAYAAGINRLMFHGYAYRLPIYDQ